MRILAALLLLAACKGDKAQPRAARDAAPPPAPVVIADARPVAAKDAQVEGARVKAEPLVEDFVLDSYLVIVPGEAKVAVAAAKKAAKARGVQFIEGAGVGGGERQVAVEVWDSPVLGMQASEMAGLAVGVDKAELEQIVAAKQALHVELRATRAVLDQGLVDVVECAVAAANAAHGWVFDLTSYQLFTPAMLEKLRGGDPPIDARRFTTIRTDPGNAKIADTKGMHRLGLPELVMRDIPFELYGGVVLVMYATAQYLIENGQLPRDGELDLDLVNLGTRPWPSVATAVERNGGDNRITLTATWSHPSDDTTPTSIELSVPFAKLGPMLGDTSDFDPGGYFAAMRD